MHNKPHTPEAKAKIKAKQEAWRLSPEYKAFLERQRERGKESPTKFKKGHKPLIDGKNLLGLQAGNRHWNWKGGINPEVMKLRRSKKYRDWRDDVFKRDDYTCQECGVRGSYLEADHYPIPWCVIFEEMNLKLMWDISNGRTLCRKCHDKTKKNWRKYYEKQ